MISPGVIVEALVASLASIPELNAALGGSGEISGYHPTFAESMNFSKALHALNPGSILVRWLGTGEGSLGENQIWKHRIGVYIRPSDSTHDDEPDVHYAAARLIVDGVPNGGGAKLLNRQLLPGLDLMDVPTLQVVVDTEGLEYFLVTFGIPEIGDN